MKKKVYFYSLLMAIVMMVVSPTIMWAVSMGDDDDPPMDEPMPEPEPEPEPEPDPQPDPDQGQEDPCMSGAHSLEETSRSPATCTEVGYINYSCINCGVVYTEYDDPTGHNFIEGYCITCGALESGDSDYTGSGDFIYISGSGGFDGEGAEKLIDGNDRTKWCSNWYEDSNPYVIFKAAGPISITGYSMVHGNDTGTEAGQGREWATWTIYGANFASDAEATEDSEEWQEVDSRSGFSYGDDYSFGDLSCGLYQYYKIVVESNYFGELQQMAEIHFTYNVCEHQWGEDGKCTNCGSSKCNHEYWNNGECENCGYVCEHNEWNWEDQWLHKCCICGMRDEHEVENCVCTVCNAEVHQWSEGVCEICEKVCRHEHLEHVDAKAANCVVYGWEEYYKCECGLFFTDAEGTNQCDYDEDIFHERLGHDLDENLYCQREGCGAHITFAENSLISLDVAKTVTLKKDESTGFMDPAFAPLYTIESETDTEIITFSSFTEGMHVSIFDKDFRLYGDWILNDMNEIRLEEAGNYYLFFTFYGEEEDPETKEGEVTITKTHYHDFIDGVCTECEYMCQHEKLVHEEAQEVDCINDGNIEFYRCEECNLPFADAERNEPLDWDKIIIPSLGHNINENLCCERCKAQINITGILTPNENHTVTSMNSYYINIVDPTSAPLYQIVAEDNEILMFSSVAGDIIALFDKDFHSLGEWTLNDEIHLEEAGNYYLFFTFYGEEEDPKTREGEVTFTLETPSAVATVTINGVETTYTDIGDAFDAVYYSKNSTLKLLTNVEVPFGFPYQSGCNATLDLNNHTYTASLNEEYNQFAFEIYGANVTVKNGTINSNNLAAFDVESNSTLTIDNCTIETGYDGIWVDNSSCVVNIINTNVHKITGTALYVNGILNISGNCSFSNDCSTHPIFVGADDGGAINLDLGYMMVDKNGERITRLIDGIGSGIVSVVADPDAVAECAAGSHSMMHHDAVSGTCTEHGKAEYWHCTTCQRFYADAAGNTILPLGIIPETPIAHHFVDGRCTVCHMVELAEPVMVTESNYASLGLDEKYVGYYAIQNPSNLAFVAELFGGQLEPASEPETGVGGPFCAPRRANKENGNGQQIKTRRNAVRKAPGEQGDVLGFVLTDNIVVNANLLDANGMPNDRDNNGNIRSGLLAWTPMHLYNNADKTIFDGNGHTISGLYQNTPVRYSLGFIKAADEGVTIKNLGITDSYFGSIMEDYGGACGSLIDYSYADIENCWSDATIDVQNADYASIGGLVGFLEAGNISDSYFSGRIMSSGARMVAGLIANMDCYSDDVTISNCHFSGSMSCKQGNIGYCEVAGLINYISANNGNLMIIERCYADGEIDAKGSNTIVSGLFNNQYTDGGTVIVRNNYNAMTVNAPSYYGLFYSAQGNGNISFNVNADKNAFSPYSNAYISGGRNVSVADEENVEGIVLYVTEEQMASGAVAYMLNEWNKDIDPTEGVTPGETPDVTPGETPGTEERPIDGPGEVPTTDPTDGGAFIEPGMDDPMCAAPRRATEEETVPAVIWYQLIGEDAHPVLAGDEYSIVYCDDEEPTPASVFYNLARTLDSFALVDATEYTFKSKTNVAELTYTRTFVGTNWTTWYVPFDLVLNDEICAKLAFSRINNVHQYDDNEDGNADRTVIESFRQKAGVTLKANYPYLVKALDESALSFELNLSDVELAPAMENSIDCQSVDYLYTFTGTYTDMGDSGLSSYSLFDDENSNNWLHFYSLEPQRHYMTITPRNGGNGAGPAHVKLMVIGDEDADGIVTIYSAEQQCNGTYDLMGRKLDSNSKQPGLRIVNGKKVLFK